MKKLLIVFLSFTLSLAAIAKEKESRKSAESTSSAHVALSGTISDSGSGELLAGVEVKIEGTDLKTYTDFDGNFSFKNITPGEYKLVTNYISYQKSTENLKVDGKQNQIEIKLENPK
jgi:hypothetical protein